MSPKGNAVPEPASADSDAVVTALESAEIFRARGDLNEAARWLRRAAELASDDGSDQRALSFAQAAAELATTTAAESEPEPEAPRAPVDDIMAELFDQPLAPALKPKGQGGTPAVAAPQIPPPALLPSIPQPPPLLDAIPPPAPHHIQAAFARTEAMPARAEISPPTFEPAPPAVAQPAAAPPAPPPLPSPARPQSEPPHDPTPSSIPDAPPLRPSGIVSVTGGPPAMPAAKAPSVKAAPLPEFDDNPPATIPHVERNHEATRRTAVWAGQELLAQSMTEEATEPGQTWEDQTQADSTSASWAVDPATKPRSEPPPKPKPRAPTLSKLDIDWEAPSAPRVQEAAPPPSLNAATTRGEPGGANYWPDAIAGAPPARPRSAPIAPSARTPFSTATLPAGSMATEAAAAREAVAAAAASPAVPLASPEPPVRELAPQPAARPPARVRAPAPTRRAVRGTLQATTEDGVYVFVPLSAQQRPELHTHEALVVLLSPQANLEP